MKFEMILIAIRLLMRFLTPDLIKKGKDYIVKKINDYVTGTENTVDDFFWNALKGGGAELKVLGDAILDFCEDYVLGTASKIDDALVLPACNAIRIALDIPDND